MDLKKYVPAARKYARDVLSGKIPACEFVKQACQRFLDDLKRKNWPYKMDRWRAGQWCAFLEMLPHTKGKWAAKRELLVLSPWQIFCTVNIFGWVHKKTGLRRFREVYIEVPRKNGKSLWMAGIGLGGISIDEEPGAEVYCGATSEKQALEVFKPARLIANRLPNFCSTFNVVVHTKTLHVLDGGKFEPVIGNPGDGPSPSIAIVDELHEHKNSDLVDTFDTGMGAREQPLLAQITTAGSDMGGPCYEKRMDIIKILNGSVEDERVFGIIYTLDEDDQWDTVEAQKKANPNYGISIDPLFLEGKLEQAKRSAAKQTAYKTKHLNLWVGAKAAWMNMLAFQRCRKQDLTFDAQKGRSCYVAADLASKTDIAAVCYLFPPDANNAKWMAFFKYYLPEDVILNSIDTAKLKGVNTRYKAWHADGWITSTEGNIIDFDVIEEDIKESSNDYVFKDVGYDPYQAILIATHLGEAGFNPIEIRQTVSILSEPMKEVEAMILTRKIHFSIDPVIAWMFSNVVAKLDKKDNIWPDKEAYQNKIDGVVALIMAVRMAIAKKGKSDSYTGSGPRLLESA